MIANTAFTYIPVLVAWSSVKRFGGNPLLGIFLGLVLINDQLLLDHKCPLYSMAQ